MLSLNRGAYGIRFPASVLPAMYASTAFGQDASEHDGSKTRPLSVADAIQMTKVGDQFALEAAVLAGPESDPDPARMSSISAGTSRTDSKKSQLTRLHTKEIVDLI